MHAVLMQKIDDVLQQTQCTQCGFEGCLPYAKALASNQADLNRCPPGGQATIEALSALLNKPAKPLDPTCGTTIERHIARIDPEHCIGCTLCIKACPVDAILGSSKRRHAVIAELCTGCELCIAPCPVDCIDMVMIPQHAHWSQAQAHEARQRMHARQSRLMRQKKEQHDRLEAKAIHKLDELNQKNGTDTDLKRSVVQAALDRARARRRAEQP